MVVNPFKENSIIDYNKVYEISYMQQRLGDNLVDLEIEYIDRILNKLDKDPEPLDIKANEINLWTDIKKVAKEGRRTGNGFTALADMLAAVNIKYNSDEALKTVRMVLKVKMEAELDATIDMAISRGAFVGWDRTKEFKSVNSKIYGQNSFFQMIHEEFPMQAAKMLYFGRRNVSWSTVAPTGTVSLMTQTTSGLEPLFKAYYIRRKKINPDEEGVKVDFIDQNGDTWQEYAVLHPKFKEWIKVYLLSNMEIVREDMLKGYKFERRDIDESFLEDLISYYNKDQIQELFKLSPWYGSEANDIPWENRIKMQSIIQRYTSNAISSTVNLPKDISKETVKSIYLHAYKHGLKGITVYRDGSRSGVLLTETTTQQNKFEYTKSIKRPNSLKADYHNMYSNGDNYGVVVGLLDDKPYEIFAFPNPIYMDKASGEVIKVSDNYYCFKSNRYTIDHLEVSLAPTDIQVLTRFTSGMLRHGMNPEYIIKQIEKSNVGVVSFAKSIIRVLKQYVKNTEQYSKELCENCHQPTIIREEGCKKCTSCGNSKC